LPFTKILSSGTGLLFVTIALGIKSGLLLKSHVKEVALYGNVIEN